MDQMEVEVENSQQEDLTSKTSKPQEQRLVVRITRALSIRGSREVHQPFPRFLPSASIRMGQNQHYDQSNMVVEEPTSQTAVESGDDEVVYVDEEAKHDHPTQSPAVDYEREAENLLNKRKAEVETEAEKRARKTHEAYARQGVKLTEVIDEVAAEHGDLHEKASTIRLQLDAYKTRIMDTGSSGNNNFQETGFLYEEDLQETAPKRKLEVTSEEAQLPQPSLTSTKVPRLRKFVSPTKSFI